VLGYVFEKYTNQKEMGAYYTKEDITGYISKNTILPFILQKVAAKLPASVWDLLKNDPDRYIYEPVRRGARGDEKEWKKSLPKNIAIGLDVSADAAPDAVSFVNAAAGMNEEAAGRMPAPQVARASCPEPSVTESCADLTISGVPPTSSKDEKCRHDARAPLLARRKDWNTPAPASHALPTEIWRETIARHQRCHDLRRKLRAGEVKDPADLVTLNLDIRQFVQDIIANAPVDLALALWKALRSLSVLDPTCGSGAFLFAALEILEPLYEDLLERLRTLLSDWRSSGEKHPVWEKEIQLILQAVDRHPNEAYFIHKTIIVHNLYGVDIMEEAVEICKLRLFLKLAAQLEPGQAIEPLPDIDFNIRSGNTLVGYASREEIRRAFSEAGGDGQMALQGIENSLDDFRHIMEDAEDADRMFQQFQLQQDLGTEGAVEQRAVKQKLERKHDSLRLQLDRFLAAQYDQRNVKTDTAFKKWRSSHEPFHWFVEFYGIMNSGGFDVIVGNPPWKEYSAVKKTYTVQGYKTERCGNLYGLCTERCVLMVANHGFLSFIVQLPIVSSSRMDTLRGMLGECASFVAVMTCDDRPGKLFDALQHCRSTIFILQRRKGKNHAAVWSSGYRRWATEAREYLLSVSEFAQINEQRLEMGQFPKLATGRHVSAFERIILQTHKPLGTATSSRVTSNFVFYQESAQYWIKATKGLPYYAKNKHVGAPAHGRYLYFTNAKFALSACAILNSSLFYTYFIAYTDCFHLSDMLATSFPVFPELFSNGTLQELGERLMADLESNAERKTINTKDGNKISYDEFRVGRSKPIIDEIDTILARHYGFTAEELDFIINYDIKYRMGLGGGSAEEEEEESP